MFDLGNVLVEWDRRFLFEKVIADPAELDHFLDEVLTLEVNAQLDLGQPLPEVVAALVAAHPEYQLRIEAFRDRWIETLGDVIAGTVGIVEELAATDVMLLALSNFGRDTFALAETRLPFLSHFDGLVISGREGMVKPDPAIFELLCARYGVDPAATVFVDDSAANVATADRLGFHTIRFRSPEQCRRALVDLGLDLTADPP